MAHVHDVHESYRNGSTTIVESDRESPATAFLVLIGLIILGVMIWFFAFSGVVFNRGSSNNGPDINIRNQNPPAQNNNTNTNPGYGNQPNPNPS